MQSGESLRELTIHFTPERITGLVWITSVNAYQAGKSGDFYLGLPVEGSDLLVGFISRANETLLESLTLIKRSDVCTEHGSFTPLRPVYAVEQN